MAFLFENFFTLLQYFNVFAGVFLVRGDEVQRAVFVLEVIVVEEVVRPVAGGLKGHFRWYLVVRKRDSGVPPFFEPTLIRVGSKNGGTPQQFSIQKTQITPEPDQDE